MKLTDELKELLYERGADLIGIGDMNEVENCCFKTGISVAVALPKDMIIDLQKAPTKEYYALYHSLNNKFSELPHKTVATRSGLGWIGKNCLLVTPQYGSAVRISSLMTNAPLICDEPIDRSYCGACSQCVKNCPGQALKGSFWKVGMPREEILDTEKCYKTQVEIMSKNTGIETDLCGKCFAVCSYTKKYLQDRNL